MGGLLSPMVSSVLSISASQPQYPAILDPVFHPFHPLVVIHAVGETADVRVQNPAHQMRRRGLAR